MYKAKQFLPLLLLVVMTLSACGGGAAEDATPSKSVEQIQTEAVAEFAFGLTNTALAQPPTPFPTNTTMPLNTPIPLTTASLAPLINASPTSACYRLEYVQDVTIPDNAQVAPGQNFTKTWKVKNAGTCPWDAGFKMVLLSGDAMSGSAVALASAIAPGATVDVSVNMVAPNKTGSVRGDWVMATTSGQTFGQSIYIIVNVGGATVTSTATAAAATATATMTATMTSTATP